MNADGFLCEIRELSKDIVQFQHYAHPLRPHGVNLNVRARSRFLQLEEMWQAVRNDVRERLKNEDILSEANFEKFRKNIFLNSNQNNLKWATNHVQWSAIRVTPEGIVDLDRYFQEWFHYRMNQISDCNGIRFQIAGPRFRKSRIEMLSALSSAYLGLCAVEGNATDSYGLGQLSKSSLRPRP